MIISRQLVLTSLKTRYPRTQLYKLGSAQQTLTQNKPVVLRHGVERGQAWLKTLEQSLGNAPSFQHLGAWSILTLHKHYQSHKQSYQLLYPTVDQDKRPRRTIFQGSMKGSMLRAGSPKGRGST